MGGQSLKKFDRDNVIDLDGIPEDAVLRYRAKGRARTMTVRDLLEELRGKESYSKGEAPGAAKKACGMHLRFLREAIEKDENDEVVKRARAILAVQDWDWLRVRLTEDQYEWVRELVTRPELISLPDSA